MKKQIPRRTILKAAGLGSVAAASVPALLPGLNALTHNPDNGHRIFIFVSFSQAPATMSGVLPRIGLDGAGTFDPEAGWVKGGGNFNLFDQAKPTPTTTPKPLIASGFWEATESWRGHHPFKRPGRQHRPRSLRP
jgi:hypothetical protein